MPTASAMPSTAPNAKPSKVEESPAGHAIPDASLDRAIAWLRAKKSA